MAKQINSLEDQSIEAIKVLWKDISGTQAPPYTKAYLIPRLAYRLQELHYGPCSDKLKAQLDYFSKRLEKGKSIVAHTRICKPLIGTKLIREYKGRPHEVIVVEKGFFYEGQTYKSLSVIARKITGGRWNIFWFTSTKSAYTAMIKEIRCAIYTRKSHEEGLEQAFNSLDAQRVAGESFVQSQHHEGWRLIAKHYDDGGYSGGTLNRPALQDLFQDIENGLVDCMVVYKIDRLSRSLIDFSKIVELFDKHQVTFVAVTQSFNTSSSMGRLMLNVLLSFAQYERELTSERIRDKFSASKQKGMWMGGTPPLGYDIIDRKLVINEEEAKLVRHIFNRFLILESVTNVTRELNQDGYRTKRFTSKESGKEFGGNKFCIQGLRKILVNPLYLGCIRHKDQVYQGQHEGIISKDIWDRAQKIFQTNSASRGVESRTKSPALLKGILKCQPCNAAITPSYTTKKNQQRYHYYVCSHHLRGVGCPRPATYMPSHEVDEFIAKHVCTLLKAPQVSAATWLALEKKGITQEKAFEALQDIDHVWDQLHPLERNKIVQILVDVVWVRHDGLEVHFHEHGLATLLCDEPIQTLNRKQDIFR